MRTTRVATIFIAGLIVGAIAVGGAMAARYTTGGDTEVTSIKLTGMGLPNLGGTSTYGVTELPAAIRSYHDSGQYDTDLASVNRHAQRSLGNQLRRLGRADGPGRYNECNSRGRRCREVKPAIVFDIDETSLSNYAGLDAANFSQVGLAAGAVAGNDPAITPTRDLYDFAVANGVTPFFITGRPEALQSIAQSNLEQVGYDDGFTLIARPPNSGTTIEYKSGARAEIEEQQGLRILINIGDQDSDLAGGHAVRAFKLPNPMYFIP